MSSMFWKRKPTSPALADPEVWGAETTAPFVCSHCGRSDLREAGGWDPPICLKCDAAINEDSILEQRTPSTKMTRTTGGDRRHTRGDTSVDSAQMTRAIGLVALAVMAVGLVACGSNAGSQLPEGIAASATSSTHSTPSARSREKTPAPSLVPAGEAATVIRVVDGDTIHARLNGVDEKVRIIGLDSPETNKPGTPVECFAREATAAAKRLLKPGDPILLQPDPTQDKRDRYGRLLTHVFLADGTLFAETMIRQGDAIHYVYDGVPSIHADQLAAAEAAAKASHVGLWSPTTCRGNPHESSEMP